MGGALNVSVAGDRTTIGGDVLSEFATAMVALVADVVRNPKFPGTELPRLKADLSRQLAVALSEPQQIALEKFRAVMYGDHPTGRVFPTDEMIKRFTADQVRELLQGDLRRGRARGCTSWAVSMARRLKRPSGRPSASGAKGAPAVVTPPKPKSERVVHVIDRPGAVQSSVLIGLPVIDPDA